MKGYKGMKYDMTCRGMQFEVGKTYHIDGEIIFCKNGLHFCEKLIDVFDFYDKDKSRFFHVESGKYVGTDGKKSVTSELTILEEVPEKEINRAFYGRGYGDSNGGGYGYGGGDGYGYGYGNCDGVAKNYEYAYGGGCGDGNDYNYDYCYGSGSGYGDGYGDVRYAKGYGNGYGDGCCNGRYGIGYGKGYVNCYGNGIQKILVFIN